MSLWRLPNGLSAKRRRETINSLFDCYGGGQTYKLIGMSMFAQSEYMAPALFIFVIGAIRILLFY